MRPGKAILLLVVTNIFLYLIVVGTAMHVHWESPITCLSILILDVFACVLLTKNWLKPN